MYVAGSEWISQPAFTFKKIRDCQKHTCAKKTLLTIKIPHSSLLYPYKIE